MAELTIEQQRALAMAAARKRLAAGGAQQPTQVPDIDPMRADLPEGMSEAGGDAPTNYTPSSVPLFDPINAFGTSLVENIPVIGGPMSDMGNSVDAWFASMVEGKPVSQQERADITQAEQEAFPAASISGGAAGLIGPLGALSKIPGIARALGMTGSLPARMAFGTASGGGLSALDTLTRGGSFEDIATAGGLGAGVGAAFPLAARGISSVLAATGAKVPKDVRLAARALGDDEISPADLPRKLREMGDDAMVMDLGPNAQSQAGALASVPGPAQKQIRDVVAQRAKGAGGRVAADVDATIGTSPDIMTLTDQITTAQSAAAKPLYDAVRDVPIQVPPVVDFILKSPLGQQAFRQAQRLAANDGYRLPEGQFTVGLVDYAKRALDDIATSAARQGNNNVARQARNMTKGMTAAVDAQVPAYKQARDAFAGPAQVLDAVESGQTVFTKEMSPAQLKSQMAQMSTSERDGFLAGAQGSIEAMLGNAVNNPLSLRNTFKKGWNEQKLRLLLGDEIADDLLKRIDREAAFSTTTNVVSRNSETARRQAAQQEVAPEMRDVGSTSLTGLILSAINKARTGLRGKLQPQVNARLAAILSSGARDLDPALLEQIRLAQQPRPNAMIAPAAPAVALTAGPQ